ncbi:hypothetical protein SLEP1_g19689 [Rubroshorea leprosula]|uniref:F-box domain-containing protein n=1 Tax=Rubroshorea leprosula TaxID=152421 RepID=A0AAV5J674_9ROSI|nr:hypothetical protein SLEP1_g19689 [Rubroshorea leprosula]
MAGRVQGYWIFYLVREILARLPLKSLMRFKSLSKQWKFEISGDKFNRFRKQLSVVEHKDFWGKDLGGDSHSLLY